MGIIPGDASSGVDSVGMALDEIVDEEGWKSESEASEPRWVPTELDQS